MSPSHTNRVSAPPRRGSLIPAAAIAILVVGGCVALVLDRLWIISAHRELQAAADAAALAGAARLADDELLSSKLNSIDRAEAARQIAATVASRNTAAGQTISVDPSPYADVRLGRVVVNEATGLPQFLETESDPTSVLVTAHCDRAHNNPVSLFFPWLTGQSSADVVARAEASVDNHLLGVRPLDSAPVPAWPLGVLETAADPRQTDTWIRQIEQREGNDRFAFDGEAQQVLQHSDGIPEIVLAAPTRPDKDHRANMCLLDVGSGLRESELIRQFQTGWTWQDCQDFGSQFELGNGTEKRVSAIPQFSRVIEQALASLVGQARIFVLYREIPSPDGKAPGFVTATRLASGRIMHVSFTDQGLDIVMQPAVITTRTGLTASLMLTASNREYVAPNPYIYRLSLSY